MRDPCRTGSDGSPPALVWEPAHRECQEQHARKTSTARRASGPADGNFFHERVARTAQEFENPCRAERYQPDRGRLSGSISSISGIAHRITAATIQRRDVSCSLCESHQARQQGRKDPAGQMALWPSAVRPQARAVREPAVGDRRRQADHAETDPRPTSTPRSGYSCQISVMNDFRPGRSQQHHRARNVRSTDTWISPAAKVQQKAEQQDVKRYRPPR